MKEKQMPMGPPFPFPATCFTDWDQLKCRKHFRKTHILGLSGKSWVGLKTWDFFGHLSWLLTFSKGKAHVRATFGPHNSPMRQSVLFSRVQMRTWGSVRWRDYPWSHSTSQPSSPWESETWYGLSWPGRPPGTLLLVAHLHGWNGWHSCQPPGRIPGPP